MCLSTEIGIIFKKIKEGQEDLYSKRSAGLRLLFGKADGPQVEFSGREDAMYSRKGNRWVTWMLQGNLLGLASTLCMGSLGTCFLPSVCQEAGVQLGNKQPVWGVQRLNGNGINRTFEIWKLTSPGTCDLISTPIKINGFSAFGFSRYNYYTERVTSQWINTSSPLASLRKVLTIHVPVYTESCGALYCFFRACYLFMQCQYSGDLLIFL